MISKITRHGSNANGIAERLDGRIDVVAGASVDTGLRTTIPLTMSSISPLINVEVWTVSADLTASEIVTVTPCQSVHIQYLRSKRKRKQSPHLDRERRC